MLKRLDVYIALVAFAAATFSILGVDWAALDSLSGRDFIGIATFLVLALLSHALAIDFRVGSGKPARSSIAFLPLLSLAVLFPPAALVWAIAVMALVDEIFLRPDRSIPRTLFNTSQAVLAGALGATLFHGLAGILNIPLQFGSAVEVVRLFVPFYALAFAFFGVNLLTVSGFVAIKREMSLRAVLKEVTGQGGANLFYDLLAGPFALFAAYLYTQLYLGGLLVVLLPFLLIRYSYQSALELQEANRDLLRVLVKAIETRDPYTSGHSVRVSTLAYAIAEDYGLRASLVKDIETAALLHDIGKIDAAFADIIAKPNRLTADEVEVIQTHATKGADLLKSLTSLSSSVIESVRHHHERFDGSGYPSGLKEKEIPIGARIIMLCDSIDAMLSDRPYRSALSIEEVKRELRRCSGTQFDPQIVEAILRHDTLERAESLVENAGARAQRFQIVAV